MPTEPGAADLMLGYEAWLQLSVALAVGDGGWSRGDAGAQERTPPADIGQVADLEGPLTQQQAMLDHLGIGQLFWEIADAVMVANAATGAIVLWNPAAERIFGYSTVEAPFRHSSAEPPLSRRCVQELRVDQPSGAGASGQSVAHSSAGQ